MRYRILGWIGIVWGLTILLSGGCRVLTGAIPNGGYGLGQFLGWILGGLLVYAGVRALRRKPAGTPE